MKYLRAHIEDAQITVIFAHLGQVWVYVLRNLATSQGEIVEYQVANSVVKLPQNRRVWILKCALALLRSILQIFGGG